MQYKNNNIIMPSDDQDESDDDVIVISRPDRKKLGNKEHGHEQRRNLVILDDDDDDDDENLQSNKDVTPSAKTPYVNFAVASFQNDEDELAEGLNDLKLSFSSPPPFAKSPTCSLTNTPAELSSPEISGAWALDQDKDSYYLSNKDCSIQEYHCDEWPNYQISRCLYEKLYDHQKTGVQWLVALNAKRTGGILGDDMGLGKTFMTLTLVGGLMKAKTIRNALVLCPVSLLRTWENEAHKVLTTYLQLPSINIYVISSETKTSQRTHLLQKAMGCSKKRPHLIICTYGLLTSNLADLTPPQNNKDGGDYSWNYVVLDEGHKIKNPSTQVNKACHQVAKSPKTLRLLLTGTPIQNNLVELWSLFDWATSGKLLGRKTDFLYNFADPIQRGRDKNANESTLEIAGRANELLQEKIKSCFIQRLKKDVFSNKLPVKRDLVLWTHLSDEQRNIYQCFVTTGKEVSLLLQGEKKGTLVALTYLKKLCGHPTLLIKRGVNNSNDEWENTTTEDLLLQSQKLQALVVLITALTKTDHRVLIFSQSTRMLDIIQRVLRKVARMSRIDGSTKERDRQRLVDDFNSANSEVSCMLISTKAGGLGLTLTGADRAVIYDPSWNPAEDSQAVDRCYRIGTTKPVTIYRLIAAGTVEERMYEKQVFKDGLRRTLLASSGSTTDRYFSRDDLRRLFTLSPVGQCEMLERIKMLNNGCPPTSPTGTGGTLSLLEKHPSIVGISSHDALYNGAAISDIARGARPFNGTSGNFKISEGVDEDENYILLGKQQGMLNKTRRDRDKAKHVKSVVFAETEQNVINVDEDADSIIDLSAPNDKLTAGEEKMEELLSVLERTENVLGKMEKLMLHKQIAGLARDLGWL